MWRAFRSLAPSMFPLSHTGGSIPFEARISAARAMMAWITNIPAIPDIGPTGLGTPSRRSSASPNSVPLSITTSATSCSFFPDECLEVTASAYRRLVTVTTSIPRARASMAISTGTALRPEFEITMRRSSGVMRRWSRIAGANPSSRSSRSLLETSVVPVRLGSRIASTGTSPPARYTASSAMQCECPVPKVNTTPPAATVSATISAARVMASPWVWTIRSISPRARSAYSSRIISPPWSDPPFVWAPELGVALVRPVHVGADEDGRLPAGVHVAAGDLGRETLGDHRSGDRGERAHAKAAAQVDHGVTQRRSVVDHHVGHLEQALAAGVAGGDGSRVLHGRHRDDRKFTLPRGHGHLHGRPVAPRVRHHDERVPGPDVVDAEQLPGDGRVPLQRRVEDLLHGSVPSDGQVSQGHGVERSQASGSRGQLHGERFRMPGPEDVDHPAVEEPGREEVGGPLDLGHLGPLHPAHGLSGRPEERLRRQLVRTHLAATRGFVVGGAVSGDLTTRPCTSTHSGSHASDTTTRSASMPGARLPLEPSTPATVAGRELAIRMAVS